MDRGASPAQAKAPIDHVIVIFQENHSFDNYFGTSSFRKARLYMTSGRAGDDESAIIQGVQVGIVVNPRAGRRIALDRAKQAATELAQAGCHCEMVTTTAPGAAARLAAEMAGAGCDVVFAAGGDGTINEVVQGLAGTGTALGVVPAGLANVWARDLQLHSRPGAFASLAADGRVFDTDLGIANGRRFLVMAGVGFDAKIVASVDPATKARWAQLAYVGKAAIEVRRWPPALASITVDDRPLAPMPLFGAIVTNTNKYGGVLDLAPDSRLDDGVMDALIWRDDGLLGRVRSALFADARLRRWDSRATTLPCEQLTIEAARALDVHADAEPAGQTPCELRVLPRALPVLLPAAACGRYLAAGRPLKPLAHARSSRSSSATTERTP